MKYTVQSGQEEFTSSVQELIEKKLEKIAQKFDWVISADIFLKKEEVDPKKGNICEIRLSVPGPRLFASSSEASIEAAAAATLKALEIQLKKRKDEMKVH